MAAYPVCEVGFAWRRACIAATGCLIVAAWTCAPRPDSCQHPGLEETLEHSRGKIGFTGTYFPSPEADSIRIDRGMRSILWLAARWSGPDDGAILALSCGGEVLGTARLGTSDSLRIGPALRGLAYSVLVYVSSPGGTGARRQEVFLLSMRSDSILRVWSDTTFAGDYSMPTQGGTETVKQPKLSATGDTIRIAGVRRMLRYDSARNTWRATDSMILPQRVLCWEPNSLSFRSCGP
jgi:hypothetical protein